MIDWDNIDANDFTPDEHEAIRDFIEYVDSFGANDYLRGRSKGALREKFIAVLNAFDAATAPMERVDVALDVETLRLAREIHAMVSECSGHIRALAPGTPAERQAADVIAEAIAEASE